MDFSKTSGADFCHIVQIPIVAAYPMLICTLDPIRNSGRRDVVKFDAVVLGVVHGCGCRKWTPFIILGKSQQPPRLACLT